MEVFVTIDPPGAHGPLVVVATIAKGEKTIEYLGAELYREGIQNADAYIQHIIDLMDHIHEILPEATFSLCIESNILYLPQGIMAEIRRKTSLPINYSTCCLTRTSKRGVLTVFKNSELEFHPNFASQTHPNSDTFIETAWGGLENDYYWACAINAYQVRVNAKPQTKGN
jgi:hypothetical protein